MYKKLGGSEIRSARWIVKEKLLDEFDLLCINDKQKTYYRVYNGYKSNIDLSLVRLTIAKEYLLSK